jgi:hypothetical protein
MTSAAHKSLKEREQILRSAKSAQEREQIRKETKLFRLHLTFDGEDADLVKKVLGKSPADKIVEFCRKEITNQQDQTQ